MILINIFLITASDEGQYQLKYQIWDWFHDKSCLLSLYWSASQLEDPQNSVCICAIENHPNVIYKFKTTNNSISSVILQTLDLQMKTGSL